MGAPLILTLMLDESSQAFFDAARKRWFPPKLDFIRAHVTLFHHLPGEQLEPILAYLGSVCARQKPGEMSVTGVRSLGRGVAYCLRSQEIEALRAMLAARWRDELTAQDRQGWRPHVTVQNKVTPAQARDLLGEMSRAFVPFSVTATGLSVWWYRGGPWESAATVPFGG